MMMISTIPSRPSSTLRRQRPFTVDGFTLVELLVVIGIIALLISILLPALANARESAFNVKCQAQERQILQAMVLHANAHGGFMPLTGYPVVGLDPQSLLDPRAQHYDYYTDGGGDNHLMSIVGALAPLLGQSVDTGSRATVERDIQSGTVRQIFECPSDGDGARLGRTVMDGGDAYNSYVFNDAALGWGTSVVSDGSGLTSDRGSHRRLRGKVNQFVHPAELLLFSDGAPRADGGWQVYCDGDAELSLRDFFLSYVGPSANPHAATNGPPPGLCSTWDLIDMTRHRGRMNVAFADGHVECVRLTEGALDNVSINKGFPAN